MIALFRLSDHGQDKTKNQANKYSIPIVFNPLLRA